MIASIDLSLRSTGVCVLSMEGKLVDCKLITPAPSKWNNEELLIHISEEIVGFLGKYHINAIAIEGLSFNSFSSEKDKINGNFWHLRCVLTEKFPGISIGIIPVTSWRNYLLSKEVQREVKKSSDKLALKKACIARLPKYVEEQFSSYLNFYKLPSKGMMDLTDAFHLGMYRLSLES